MRKNGSTGKLPVPDAAGLKAKTLASVVRLSTDFLFSLGGADLGELFEGVVSVNDSEPEGAVAQNAVPRSDLGHSKPQKNEKNISIN